MTIVRVAKKQGSAVETVAFDTKYYDLTFEISREPDKKPTITREDLHRVVCIADVLSENLHGHLKSLPAQQPISIYEMAKIAGNLRALLMQARDRLD